MILSDIHKAADLVKTLKQRGKVVVSTSGYFDPIHFGHIDCITESKIFGDILLVIINGDMMTERKKGKAFMPAMDRARIVDSIEGVDYVVIYDTDKSGAVSEALEVIKPNSFTKGGDRVDMKSIPEWDTCEKNEIQIITGIGQKVASSSEYLAKWVQNAKKK